MKGEEGWEECPICMELTDFEAENECYVLAKECVRNDLKWKKGKGWAQSSLGDMYDMGKYVEKNMEKAIYYYNLAAKQGDYIAIFFEKVMGYQLIMRKQYIIPN